MSKEFTKLPVSSSIDGTDLIALAQDVATTPTSRSATTDELFASITELGPINLTGNLTFDTDITYTGSTFTNANVGGSFQFNPEGSGVNPEGSFIVTHGGSSGSGATIPYDTSALVLDSASSSNIAFLTPNNSAGGIIWGDVANNNMAYITYFHIDNAMRLRVNDNATHSQIWNSDGTVSKPLQSYFNAYRSTSLPTSLGATSWIKIQFNAVNKDRLGDYDNISTYSYTARQEGVHFLAFAIEVNALDASHTDIGARIFTSNKYYRTERLNPTSVKLTSNQLMLQCYAFPDMDIGDIANVEVYLDGNLTAGYTGAENVTYFTGGLLY